MIYRILVVLRDLLYAYCLNISIRLRYQGALKWGELVIYKQRPL